MGEVDRPSELAPIAPLPEQPAQRSREVFNFTDMTPDEIVQIHRDISGTEYDDAFSLVDRLTDAFMRGMENLCVAEPDLAANALEILATNAYDDDERGTASHLLVNLARTNRPAALTLTETLLRDTDSWVRLRAYEAISTALDAGAFTPIDALHLRRIYTSVDNTAIRDQD